MKIQEIFDTVLTHLAKQQAQATDGSTCKYLDLNGHRCAVGCLIKPEHYNPSIEGSVIGTMSMKDARKIAKDRNYQTDVKGLALRIALNKSIGGLTKNKLRLLEHLQFFHDNYYMDLSEYEQAKCVQETAKTFNLTINEPMYRS